MRRPALVTASIAGPDELTRHFDGQAAAYAHAHGHAQRLLGYRLSIVEHLLGGARRGTLLEIGCGTAMHLIALAPTFERALGTDISPEMVRVARRAADASAVGGRIELRVDPAEELATVTDRCVDVVLCVGSLEHMLDKARVLAQVRRVLRCDGTFVCLTPNGGYCWYRTIAPQLGLDTRHLSTDRFVDADELDGLLRAAGLARRHSARWRFVPKGDMPPAWGHVLHGLDVLGRLTSAAALRGGIAVAAQPVPAPVVTGDVR